MAIVVLGQLPEQNAPRGDGAPEFPFPPPFVCDPGFEISAVPWAINSGTPCSAKLNLSKLDSIPNLQRTLSMIDASTIAAHQTELTARWHQSTPVVSEVDFFQLIEENHLRNFSIWHEEDIARRDDLGFKPIYHAKRNIDRFNQERNNFAEEMDKAIVTALQPAESGCPRNSETPGMIIDRLSILALKEYHMQEETVRPDASSAHQEKCFEKLARIRRQRADLTTCLAELLADVVARRRTFSVYFQFKMYNDPSLNPQLYGQNPPSRQS
jgi:hypothetical protein